MNDLILFGICRSQQNFSCLIDVIVSVTVIVSALNKHVLITVLQTVKKSSDVYCLLIYDDQELRSRNFFVFSTSLIKRTDHYYKRAEKVKNATSFTVDDKSFINVSRHSSCNLSRIQFKGLYFSRTELRFMKYEYLT